jgi:anthranilate phosphoribosyltransferase
VLEALGVRLVSTTGALRRSLAESGMAFLYAPAQHPAMKHAIGPRRRLGLRTVFNLLGPLTNPAGARRQVLGVYDDSLVEPVARALGRLGARHVLVVHGAGGLDEISTLGSTRVAECREGNLDVGSIEPESLGLSLGSAAALAGGSAVDNARIIERVLDGESGPRRDIVLANAGAAIYVSGGVKRLRDGVERAAASIDSGAARRALDRLIASTARGDS